MMPDSEKVIDELLAEIAGLRESNKQLIRALALAGIHAEDCPEGKRNHTQKFTGMYLDPQPCTCWVRN
jgi:hypothetical protein